MKRTNVTNYINILKKNLHFGNKHYPKDDEALAEIKTQILNYSVNQSNEEQKRINVFLNAAQHEESFADLKLINYIMKNHNLEQEHLFDEFTSEPVEEDGDNNMNNEEQQANSKPVNTTPVSFNTKKSDAINAMTTSHSAVTTPTFETTSARISLRDQQSTTNMINMLLNPKSSSSEQLNRNSKAPVSNKALISDGAAHRPVQATEQAEKIKAEKEEKERQEQLRKQQEAQQRAKEEQRKREAEEKERKMKEEAEKEVNEMHYRIFDNHNQATTLSESKIIELAQKYNENITSIRESIDELGKHGLMVW